MQFIRTEAKGIYNPQYLLSFPCLVEHDEASSLTQLQQTFSDDCCCDYTLTFHNQAKVNIPYQKLFKIIEEIVGYA